MTSYPSVVVGMVPAIPFPGYQWMSRLASVHQLFNITTCCYRATQQIKWVEAMFIYIPSLHHSKVFFVLEE